jgi:hypothetical protein
MTRLTLEPLERRDLLSANPFAGSLVPPAPPAYSQLELAGTFHVPYTYPDHNNLLTAFTSPPRPETNGRSLPFAGDGHGATPSIIAILIGFRSAAGAQECQIAVGSSDLGWLNDIGPPGGRPTGFGLSASAAMREDTAYTHHQTDLEFLLVNSTGNDMFDAAWATFPGSFGHAPDTPDRAGLHANLDVKGDSSPGTDAGGWLPGRFIDASLIYGSNY